MFNSLEIFNKKQNNSIEDFFNNALSSSYENITTQITEDENNYYFDFEMPGIKKEDIQIDINENTLLIQADKKKKESKENEKIHYNEIFYGKFKKRIRIPSACDVDNLEAIYNKQGMLIITIPKKEKNTKKIKIKEK